jgi:hypothetical protein
LKYRKYIEVIIISILLIVVSVALLSIVKSYRSTLYVSIYLLSYFVIFFFLKNSRFWISSKYIIGFFLFINFPSLWTDGKHMGIAPNWFVINDLFARDNLFITHGPNLIESIKMKDIYLVFQIYSLTLASIVFFKLIRITIDLRSLFTITWLAFRKNILIVSISIGIYIISHIFFFSSLITPNLSPDLRTTHFNSAIVYIVSYLFLLIVFKTCWKVKYSNRLRQIITIIFILFFPIITVSTYASIQYTDSMDYFGLYPTISTFGSSFNNTFNYLFIDTTSDPLKESFKLMIFGLFQVFFIVAIILTPVKSQK